MLLKESRSSRVFREIAAKKTQKWRMSLEYAMYGKSCISVCFGTKRKELNLSRGGFGGAEPPRKFFRFRDHVCGDCPARLRLAHAWLQAIGTSSMLCLRWRPYRVEYTGSLPTSEVKRRRARLVLGWGTAREDLRVLPAFCQLSFRRRDGKHLSFSLVRRIPARREVHAMVSPMWLDACVCLCGMLTLVPVCLGARQLN